MQICLIFVWSKRNNNSIAALAGALEELCSKRASAFKLVISKGNLREAVCSQAIEFDRIIIGFSFMTVDYPVVKRQLDGLRSIPQWMREKIILIAGGAHPSGEPLECLQSGFDYVVIGEGEETLWNLASSIEAGDPIDEIAGIAFLNEQGLTVNRPDEPVDIDLYPPFPTRRGLMAPLEISRGCPFQCVFCQTPRIHGASMRHRTIRTICKYLRLSVKKGRKRTWFTSANALAYGSKTGRHLNLPKVETLLKSIKENTGVEEIFFGTFPSELRPEFLTNEAASVIREHCDNTRVCIGAQSGSQRLLEYVRRGHGIEAVYNALDVCKEYDLTPILDLIFGLPTENEEDRERTRDLIKYTVSGGGRIHAHLFSPLPDTPLESMVPGRVHPTDKRLLEELISHGKVFGNWVNKK